MAAPNTNRATGIRYGVVSLASLHDDVFEQFVQDGINLSYEAALSAFKQMGGDEEDFEYEGDEDEYEWEDSDKGLSLGLSTLGGAYNVWVFASPVVAFHALCSPCCPNAGDVGSVGTYPCYSLPQDWFKKEDD